MDLIQKTFIIITVIYLIVLIAIGPWNKPHSVTGINGPILSRPITKGIQQ